MSTIKIWTFFCHSRSKDVTAYRTYGVWRPLYVYPTTSNLEVVGYNSLLDLPELKSLKGDEGCMRNITEVTAISKEWIGNDDCIDVPKLSEADIKFVNPVFGEITNNNTISKNWKVWLNELDADGMRDYMLKISWKSNIVPII